MEAFAVGMVFVIVMGIKEGREEPAGIKAGFRIETVVVRELFHVHLRANALQNILRPVRFHKKGIVNMPVTKRQRGQNPIRNELTADGCNIHVRALPGM